MPRKPNPKFMKSMAMEVEKAKTPECSFDEPETIKTAKKVREGIDTLAALGEFEKTEMGQEIVEIYGLESMADVFEDEDIFIPVIAQLNALQEEVDTTHIRAFFIMSAEKYPDFVAEALENDEDFQINDPETLEMVMKILEIS
ncbi:hypothetical protein KKA33_01105 [Patescibacteria group bacterium]|nr:hypothetical protein [Patescibacteria group bacterium]